MNRLSFRAQVSDYILSGHALLHVHTPEKSRLMTELTQIAGGLPPDGRPIFTWSPAVGWTNGNGQAAKNAAGAELGPPDPQIAPRQILEMPDEAVFVLKDFGTYLQSRTYPYADIVIAWLGEIRDMLANSGRTIIFVGVGFDIPAELQHDITTLEFSLPGDEAIEQTVRFIGEDHPVDEAAVPAIVTACRAMTQQQIEDRTALALRRFKRLGRDAAHLILSEKAEVIRRTGLLEYRDPPAGGLDLIGGWENVKRHVQLDKPCFTDAARKFGIEFPRGLLLVGISGGGKTQMSLCIASYLGLPLIQMDAGRLLSKWVGESERNMREAIRLLESLGACVLQLDEVEKGFGGAGGDLDGGAAQRSFGVFLKWLSDRTCPIYVVATANNIRALPVEFTRKGRFDELYGVYLPTHAERQDIFAIHLRRRQRDPSHFDLDDLARDSEGYTGADIKEVVQLALKLAFHAGDGLTIAHLVQALPEVRPLSKTDPESVLKMTGWLDGHTKPAGTGAPTASAPVDSTTPRKRRVTV